MAARGEKATLERLQAENDYLRRGGIVEQIGRTVRVALIAAALYGIAIVFGQVVESLAGKQTEANILVSMLGTLEVSMALSWAVGIGGVVYGRGQAKLRKTTVERLHQRIATLERQVDPTRTSSKLTPRGETNPEDV